MLYVVGNMKNISSTVEGFLTMMLKVEAGSQLNCNGRQRRSDVETGARSLI